MSDSGSLIRPRRMPDNVVASLLTRTNSTTSRNRGAGAFFGRLFSSGGKRVEIGLSRAAERLGFGPLALMRRIVVLFEQARTGHDLARHNRATGEGISPDDLPSLDIALRRVMHVACYPCNTCGEPYLSSVPVEGEYEVNLKGLAEYVTHVEADTRIIALECITTLAVAHDAARTYFINLEIMGDLADCEILAQVEAHRGWGKICIPATQCMEVLNYPPATLPIFSPLAERLGMSIHAVSQRLGIALEAEGIIQMSSDDHSLGSLDPLSRSIMQMVCYLPIGANLSLWDNPSAAVKSALAELLQLTRHPDPATRHVAIDYVALLAFLHSSFRGCFLNCDAVNLLQAADLEGDWPELKDPTDACLNILCGPSARLKSAPSLPVSWSAVLVHSKSQSDVFGLPTLIAAVEMPGLISVFACARLRFIFAQAFISGNINEGLLTLLADALTPVHFARWWALSAHARPVQNLVISLYEREIACCLVLGSKLSPWGHLDDGLDSWLPGLLQLEGHGDPAEWHIAIKHVMHIASTHPSFFEWYNQRSAVNLLQDSAHAVTIGPACETAAPEGPQNACINILPTPSFNREVRLRMLIAAVEIPGLVSAFACKRIRSIITEGSFGGAFNALCLELLADTLTPANIAHWWTLYAYSRPVQQLLVALYEGAADWLGFLRWPSTPSLRLWLFECLQLPLLRQMSDDASYLRAVNPRVRRKYTAHPLRGWIARLQNSPNHTPGFQGALAQDVRAMRASIADAIDQERLPLPRDELEVGFGAER